MKQLGFAKDENILPKSTYEALNDKGFKIILVKWFDSYPIVKKIIIRGHFFDITIDQEAGKVTQTTRRSVSSEKLKRYISEIKEIPTIIKKLSKYFDFLLVADARNYLEKRIMIDMGSIIVNANKNNSFKAWYNLSRKQILSHGIRFKVPYFDDINTYGFLENKQIEFKFKISFSYYTYHYSIIVGLNQIVPYLKSLTLNKITTDYR